LKHSSKKLHRLFRNIAFRTKWPFSWHSVFDLFKFQMRVLFSRKKQANFINPFWNQSPVRGPGGVWLDDRRLDPTAAVDRWRRRDPHPPSLCMLFRTGVGDSRPAQTLVPSLYTPGTRNHTITRTIHLLTNTHTYFHTHTWSLYMDMTNNVTSFSVPLSSAIRITVGTGFKAHFVFWCFSCGPNLFQNLKNFQ